MPLLSSHSIIAFHYHAVHDLLFPYSSSNLPLLFLCSSSAFPTHRYSITPTHANVFQPSPVKVRRSPVEGARSTTEVLQGAFSSPLKTLESFQDLPLKTLSDLPCQAALNRRGTQIAIPVRACRKHDSRCGDFRLPDNQSAWSWNDLGMIYDPTESRLPTSESVTLGLAQSH
jgi:hypothetical protein